MDQRHANLYFFIQKLVDHTRLQSYLWLAMVNIESFTCNTFRVIYIQILPGLIDKSMLDFLQYEKNIFSPLKPIVNVNNVVIFITFFTDGKNQLNIAHVLIKMHPTTDHNMGNKPMLVKNFNALIVPLSLYYTLHFLYLVLAIKANANEMYS